MKKAILFLAVFGLVGLAWAADPFVGTWKLNPSKTKTTGWAGAISESSTVKIEAQENGVKFRWDGVKPDGKTLHAEFAAKYDGNDYAVMGDPDSDTVSLRKIDANTVDYIFKKAGQAIFSERAVVSSDGKTISLTVTGIDSQGKPYEAILLYDSQ
ncbi:MAG: hypothetical protein H6Q04_2547 [Acidobacteria bacterium]|jgi:hypothetical protein|nr:hypothetical protein [Acidobacteriota bacterium]